MPILLPWRGPTSKLTRCACVSCKLKVPAPRRSPAPFLTARLHRHTCGPTAPPPRTPAHGCAQDAPCCACAERPLANMGRARRGSPSRPPVNLTRTRWSTCLLRSKTALFFSAACPRAHTQARRALCLQGSHKALARQTRKNHDQGFGGTTRRAAPHTQGPRERYPGATRTDAAAAPGLSERAAHATAAWQLAGAFTMDPL